MIWFCMFDPVSSEEASRVNRFAHSRLDEAQCVSLQFQRSDSTGEVISDVPRSQFMD